MHNQSLFIGVDSYFTKRASKSGCLGCSSSSKLNLFWHKIIKLSVPVLG